MSTPDKDAAMGAADPLGAGIMTMIQQWHSVSDAAKLCCVSESTIRRRIQKGELLNRQNIRGHMEVLVEGDLDHPTPVPGKLVARSQTSRVNQVDHEAAITTNDAFETEELLQVRTKAPVPKLTTKIAPQVEKAENTILPQHPSSSIDHEQDDAEAPNQLLKTTAQSAPQAAHHTLEPQLENELEEDSETTTENSQAQRALNPFLMANENEQTVNPNELDDAERFRRLAGASMVMAQKQAEESTEQLARTRFELNQARKRANIATGVAAVLGLILCFNLISGGQGEPAQASASTYSTNQHHSKLETWQEQGPPASPNAYDLAEKQITSQQLRQTLGSNTTQNIRTKNQTTEIDQANHSSQAASEFQENLLNELNVMRQMLNTTQERLDRLYETPGSASSAMGGSR